MRICLAVLAKLFTVTILLVCSRHVSEVCVWLKTDIKEAIVVAV